jgi:hypothetical protein
MHEILAVLPPHTLHGNEKRSHACMEEAVYALPQDTYDIVAGAAAVKRRRFRDTASEHVLVPPTPPLLRNIH